MDTDAHRFYVSCGRAARLSGEFFLWESEIIWRGCTRMDADFVFSVGEFDSYTTLFVWGSFWILNHRWTQIHTDFMFPVGELLGFRGSFFFGKVKKLDADGHRCTQILCFLWESCSAFGGVFSLGKWKNLTRIHADGRWLVVSFGRVWFLHDAVCLGKFLNFKPQMDTDAHRFYVSCGRAARLSGEFFLWGNEKIWRGYTQMDADFVWHVGRFCFLGGKFIPHFSFHIPHC